MWLVPVALLVPWLHGDDEARADLLGMVLAALLALGLGQVITHLWPEPRPFMLHLDSQFPAHGDVGHGHRRCSQLAWSSDEVGSDVPGALPVAALGAALARSLRVPLEPVYSLVQRWTRRGARILFQA
jgi:undecaprenyl-diphosphatase